MRATERNKMLEEFYYRLIGLQYRDVRYLVNRHTTTRVTLE